MKDISRPLAIALALVVVGVFSPVLFAFNVSNPFSKATDSVARQSGLEDAHNVIRLLEGNGGFESRDVVLGSGDAALDGDAVSVYYVGTLQDGTVFDTGVEHPFVFTLGNEEVIQGWDIGVRGMREGGTRRLTIPASLAYGAQQLTDADGNVIIPSNATLVFDIMLVHVERSSVE